MNNLNEIKKNYSTFSTEKLLNIIKEIDSLTPDAILLLQEEFIKRDKLNEVNKITEYLVNQKKEQDFKNNFSPENFIKEELKAGESLENIKFKLNNMGINMFDIINKEKSQESIILNYIESKKVDGQSKDEIESSLKQNFNLDSDFLKEIQNKLRKKGKTNLTLGIVFLIISIPINITLFIRGSVSIPVIFLFGVGIWKLVEAEHQLKK